jgi:tetratricopeptide (TPR) repeat protein
MDELQDISIINKHLSNITNIIKNKIYIETGWPCYPAIPLFYKIFKKNLKVVHLIRHPVNVACSIMTHGYYQKRNDDYVKYAQLDPFMSGIIYTEYRNLWNSMSPYEKCLFWWTEINRYALELQEKLSDIPFLQVRFEDLVGQSTKTLEELITFLCLPLRQNLYATNDTKIDYYRFNTNIRIKWRQIFKHQHTLLLAEKFDYIFEDITDKQISDRYNNQGKDLQDKEDINLALQYYEIGSLQEAERICKKILKYYSDNNEALYLLGIIHAQEDHNSSLDNAVKLIQLDPSNEEAYYILRTVFHKKGILI